MEGDRRTKSTVGGGRQENKEYRRWRRTGEQRVRQVEGDRRTQSTVGGGGQENKEYRRWRGTGEQRAP